MVFVRRTHGEDFRASAPSSSARSNLFGKPMSALLLAANATVTTGASRTKDLAAVCRNADILVAAVGRPEMVKADWVKPGATVIDVGINRVPAPEKGEGKFRLVGDVAFAECEKVAGVITPVPGGVGSHDHRHADGQHRHRRLSQGRPHAAEILIGPGQGA